MSQTAQPVTLKDLAAFVAGPYAPSGPLAEATLRLIPRDVSIWEITTWILPMTPEHLRRVLGQTPDLPQGRVSAEGGTRWFTLAEVDRLRQHFSTVASLHAGRGKTYGPQRPKDARAPLVVLTGPQGRTGRSTSLLHLACAAALNGYKVLVLDADPAGRLAADLGADRGIDPGATPTLLPLIARSCGLHLRQINAGRMDRGEAPLPMDEVMAAALEQDGPSLIRRTAWPGLDIIPATADLLLADGQIATWRNALRSWHPATALAQALDRDGLRDRYDLILCDTGRGLGPLAVSVLSAADVLLIPLMAGDQIAQTGGLAMLAQTLQAQETEAMLTARALGLPAPRFGWRRVAALAVGGGATEAAPTALGQPAPALLPHPLPHIPQVANGQAAHFYALDYRDVGRLAYAPLREACEATWRGVATMLTGLWAEDAAVSETEKPR